MQTGGREKVFKSTFNRQANAPLRAIKQRYYIHIFYVFTCCVKFHKSLPTVPINLLFKLFRIKRQQKSILVPVDTTIYYLYFTSMPTCFGRLTIFNSPLQHVEEGNMK